ncbi:molybdenum ABC transporter ATP-binding protein [Endozoicomonas sp. SCSIO W0465]|uniref:molybdenum ABC transporter ATP-binding protein n=1 Tax=Endozoicomonas sp. SCSIO W0465 TaxID=2918516 RepID=UPI002075F818|nr:molybdenum ABC transporter ATP-binding protein [Endozoicomonas sp. SCSIO W0465]USE37904.1 molybdenum ABC transporter ATP-binding protein [Endozoicomonas sp. SCSIO W0465]
MLSVDIQLPRDRFVLNVDESLDADSTWAIMGRSGCGKTSLLRTIAGLETHARGRVQFNDEVWQDSEKGIWIPPEQRGIGYIFQEARLFPHLDVMENLLFALRRARADANMPSLAEVVDQLDIEHLLGRSVDKLSGGEKQRVAIARTLLSVPRLLLMDEPLASLDWSSKTRIFPCLRNIHQYFGIPVIMVSHAREEVARLADKLVLIEQGQVLSCGECRQLLSRPGSLLTRDDCALSILEVKVGGHDQEYGFTELQFGQQKLLANQISAIPGTELRVILPAQEVSIVVEEIHCTSVQNRVATTIRAIQELDSNNVMLFMEAEGQTLLALVTRRALGLLHLSVGQRVFAHFKGSCLDVI